MLHRLDLIQAAIEELNEVIAAACTPWAHQLELLQTMPGVGPKVAQVILAEPGGDMSRFPSAAHLAARGRARPGGCMSRSASAARSAPGTATSG